MSDVVVTGYLELPIADARTQREAHGREYARERGLPWPLPPDRYGPGRQPADRAAYYQRYEAGIVEDLERERALLVVTAAMELRTGRTVQLADRTVRLADTSTKVPRLPVATDTDPVRTRSATERVR